MHLSEENVGKVDIHKSRIGGIDGPDIDRILMKDCKGIMGTEDCRVVAEEDCRTGGSHMELCFDDNGRYASHSQFIAISVVAVVGFTDRRINCPN